MVHFQDANHRVTESSFFDRLQAERECVPVDLSALNDIAALERITTENAVFAIFHNQNALLYRIVSNNQHTKPHKRQKFAYFALSIITQNEGSEPFIPFPGKQRSRTLAIHAVAIDFPRSCVFLVFNLHAFYEIPFISM